MNRKFKSMVNFIFSVLSIIYVWMLMHYALFMWETRQRYGIIFLCMTLMLAALWTIKEQDLEGRKGLINAITGVAFFILAFAGGIYFFTEYPLLVWERAGDITRLDVVASAILIYIVLHLSWITSGRTIPIVTLVFIAYAMFGHWIPGFFHHPSISFTRFMELSVAEIDGIFGPITQVGATWIAIFLFYAGFVQAFGGLDYVLRLCYKLVGQKPVNMPQVSILASMAFGGMSGSAAANAAGTGSFTIPIMKRFGMSPEQAASVETIASSGGQIMPPILGTTAFVMCDYLGMHYYQILLASIFASVLFFGSTMLSVYFIAKQSINPDIEVEVPPEFKEKLTLEYFLEGLPIVLSVLVLLIVFMVLKVNILIGGFYATASFLVSRLVYEFFYARCQPVFAWTFLKGLYQGTLKGATFLASLGAILGALGIVIRVLSATGLGQKISYYMVGSFGEHYVIFLIMVMIICIIFGMAVVTVAAYILVVTLTGPPLLQMGLDPLVIHFTVFYWAMLSAFTPPVAAVCVVTARIADANFLVTSWESMKLGAPKFILPFFFISYPAILSFSIDGLIAFIIAGVGFMALSAGLQSNWGWRQRILLLILAVAILLSPSGIWDWLFVPVTVVIFFFLWKYNERRITPVLA